MTVNKGSRLWIRFILLWVLVSILIIPVLNAVFTSAITIAFDYESPGKFDNRLTMIDWGWTLLVYSWTLFAFAIMPYAYTYVYHGLNKKNFLLQLLVFYALLVLMGLLLPEASIRESFNRGDHSRIYVLYFLTALTVCPLCNLILKWLTKGQRQ